MKIPCAKCGGSGKQRRYVRGWKTRHLEVCRLCHGEGWFDAPQGSDGLRMYEDGGRRVRRVRRHT